MPSWQQQPEAEQKFWKEGIGSGKITRVDWQYKLVYVDFFEKGTESFELDELFGCWSDELGGTWMLYNL